ncbi:hypothetical protein Tco_0525575 [Tanacetum coccineum]
MSTWCKQPPRPETPDPEWNKDRSIDDEPKQTWFNDLVNAEKDPLTFDELMATSIDFTKFAMNRLKKGKITAADLVGLVYKLLKGTYKSSIELEYNMDQCYNALTDQIDWTKPEGDRFPYELSKPLPLQGSPSHLTIPVDFFFNNDLEYLKTVISERKYTVSITKTKAARDPNISYSTDHRSIVVRRADRQEYTFKEGDFPRLHLNDIEYMLLLHVQNKLFNLLGDDIVDLVTALRMFTLSLIIKKRVEDVQLEVKSYQKKLSVTKPQKEFLGISFKEPYTTSYDPNGVVYLKSRKRKRLMRADELYKFSDETLQSIRKILHHRMLNFKFGYNKDMPKRKLTDKDHVRY